MNMEVIAVLALFGVCFAGIFGVLVWFVWRKFRVIELLLPAGSDPEAFAFRLTEAIRGLRYREAPPSGPVRLFRAPAWQQWTVGLQDISVEPKANQTFLVTGPAFNVSLIGRGVAGATKRPYAGPQPVWPLCRGFIRLMGLGVGTLVAIFGVFFILGVK